MESDIRLFILPDASSSEALWVGDPELGATHIAYREEFTAQEWAAIEKALT